MRFSANDRMLTVDGLSPAQMITAADHVRQEEVSLASQVWNAGLIHSDRYDITAKSEGEMPLGKEQSDRRFSNCWLTALASAFTTSRER